jgi:signal-transduction protein with cAMP-binding, CBS, and nucleotidyltransferase domain
MVDSNCEESIFHEGDIAIAENTPENELYLIIKGDVEVPVK